MIDTDKYEGHTPAPWRAVYVEEDGTEGFMLAQSGPDRKWLPMKNCHLAADAPLLLAEVKRLREQPKVTIDDWDKKGPCVTVYLEGCEYVGTLRLYKDENGKVIE